MSYQKEVYHRLAFLEAKPSPYFVYITLFTFLIIWELLVQLNVINAVFLPSPSSILDALFEMIKSGELWGNLWASLYRIALGFSLGSLLGIAFGLLLGYSRLADAIGTPIIYALYPIPKIALLPLIILWLGIGELSKVTIIALGVFFPVVINTYSGVKHVECLFIKVAASFSVSPSRLLRHVIWPAALPSVFSGLKLGAGTALLLLVAAEMIAAKEGLGALILHYGDLLITAKLMAGIVILSLLGLLFNTVLSALEKRFIPHK